MQSLETIIARNTQAQANYDAGRNIHLTIPRLIVHSPASRNDAGKQREDRQMDLTGLIAAMGEMDEDDSPVPTRKVTNHYAKHRAPTKDDTRGYDAGKVSEADALSREFGGTIKDLIWHFIAADIQPKRFLVRFCDPGESITGGPLIDGIIPDPKDGVGERDTLGDVRASGLPPKEVLAQMRSDFNLLNGQGKDLVLQRLRDVGHDPVVLGLAKADPATGKGKVRKAA